MSVMDIAARHTSLDAARDGDMRAFAGLLEPHRHTMWEVCLRVTNEPRHAVDALGHGLGSAWRAIENYPDRSSFGVWLSMTMAAAARAVAWHRQRSPDLPRPSAEPLRLVSTATERVLQAQLALLPVVVREAMALRQVCGLTFEQIAEHQVVGIHTVKDRLKGSDGMRPLTGAPGLDRTRFDHVLRTVLIRHQRSVSR